VFSKLLRTCRVTILTNLTNFALELFIILTDICTRSMAVTVNR